MKRNPISRAANSQEDEDGFSLNPYDVFMYNNTDEKKDFDIIRNSTNSESVYANLTLISSNEKRYANRLNRSPELVTMNRK